MSNKTEDATGKKVESQELTGSDMQAPSDSGADENSASPQASSTVLANADPSNNAAAGDSSRRATYGPIRSRVTVVCQECKRLKLKCDRKDPCSSCQRRSSVQRCLYSAAPPVDKVDIYSLHNRMTEMEAKLDALMGQHKQSESSEITK